MTVDDTNEWEPYKEYFNPFGNHNVARIELCETMWLNCNCIIFLNYQMSNRKYICDMFKIDDSEAKNYNYVSGKIEGDKW